MSAMQLRLKSGAISVACAVVTAPLWNVAARPAVVGGGSPFLSAILLLFGLGAAWFYVAHVWQTTQPDAFSTSTRLRYGCVAMVVLSALRLSQGAVSPASVEEQLSPNPATHAGSMVLESVYLFSFHPIIFWVPAWLYWRRGKPRTPVEAAGADAAPATAAVGTESPPAVPARSEAAPAESCCHRLRRERSTWPVFSYSWPMSIAVVLFALYASVAQVVDSAGGPNLLQFSPLSLLVWATALLWDARRGDDPRLRRDTASRLQLCIALIGVPIGMGSYMLRVIASTRDSPSGQVFAVLGLNIVTGLVYVLWRLTTVRALGDADKARPYDFLMVLVLELFSEIIFMDIEPLSPQFFLIVILQRTKDVVVHTRALPRARKWASGTLGRPRHAGASASSSSPGGPGSPSSALTLQSRAQVVHDEFYHLELLLHADVLATVIVTLMLMQEYVAIDLGFGIALLSARTQQFGRGAMGGAYAVIFVSQVAAAALARAVMQRRLEASRDTMVQGASWRAPAGGGAVRGGRGSGGRADAVIDAEPKHHIGADTMVMNPLHAQAAGSTGASSGDPVQARVGDRQASRRGTTLLDVGADWSAGASLSRWWQRHWLHLAGVSVFSITFTLRFVFDIKAVDYAVVFPNATAAR